MALRLVVAVFVCAPAAAEDASLLVTLRGRVVDAQTGEPIAKALVSIRDRKGEAVTDANGRFSLAGLPPGDTEIAVATVGYGLARRTVRASLDTGELEIRLGQDALKRSEEVAVVAAPFESSDPAAPTEQQLGGTELRNLANLLTDDPLRSVQSLPGIATSDDSALRSRPGARGSRASVLRGRCSDERPLSHDPRRHERQLFSDRSQRRRRGVGLPREWRRSGQVRRSHRVGAVPDISNTPLHKRPYEQFLAAIRSHTNLRAVPDTRSPTGWKLDAGLFLGWAKLPEQ